MTALIETEVDEEKVVLLNESYERIGALAKAAAHTDETPLHLAFSLFLFDSRGRMLVQRRALSKQTWPGIWSNSCCGHPMPGESIEEAVYRRTKYELGIDLENVECVLPDFRYRARWKGLWENEFCPVWVGFLDFTPEDFSREEVDSVAWVSWEAFAAASGEDGDDAFSHFSPWSKMEARLLTESEQFQRLFSRRCVLAAPESLNEEPQDERPENAL